MRVSSVLVIACLTSACSAAYALAQPGSAPNDQAGTPLQKPSSTEPPVGVSSTPPQAAPSAGSQPPNTTLETVIVTANRRAENLQNVPVSVTAVSGASLTNSGVTNLQNLTDVVPGFTVQDAGFETTRVRGVGSSAIGPGIENAVAVYVDGVYYPTITTGLLDFVDVSQVEVLKGPQGTLFGRNATGGLVQVTTKTPSHDPHLDADLSYGNYESGKADLYLTGALADKLAADLAVQASTQGQGFGYNHATNKDVYRNDSDVVARSKWVFDATPTTRLTTIFDYSQNRNSFIGIENIPGTRLAPFAGPTYRYSNPWDTDTDTQPMLFTKGGGVSTKLEHDFGFLRFSDIVAYRESYFFYTIDLDGTATPFERTYLFDREHSFSEEAQIQSEKQARVQYTAGIYYFSNDAKYTPGSQIQFPGPAFNPVAPLDAIGIIGQQITTSAAGYFQANTEILPKTNLTFGARYTYEERQLKGSEQGIIPGDIPIATLATADTSKNFYRPTFRVALDHRFSPEVLAYASFNTGFKSGGYNTQSITDPAFNPETLKAYEVGLKTDLFDRRVRFNGSFFYYDYDHVQIALLEGAATGIINGPNARVYGLDLDYEGRVTTNFTLSGGFEYTHDRFTTSTPFVPIGAPGGGVPLFEGSAEGNRLPVTPDAVVDLRGDYKFDFLGGRANANVTYQYNTGWDAEPDNVIHQAPFNLLNASVRWKSPSERYTVAVYGTNLTSAPVQSFGSTLPSGIQLRTLAPPRLYGATVGYHF